MEKNHTNTPSSYPSKYLGTLTACFSVILILSNITSAKPMNFFGYPLDVGLFIFPLAYILGDVLAEVYGYQASRRVVLTGFCLMVFTVCVLHVATIAPPAIGWKGQTAFEQVFGLVPRISLASLIAYVCGELTNSRVLVAIKQKTAGKLRYLRMIGSTVVGQAIDTTLFMTIAFGGVWTNKQLLVTGITSYLFKVVFEIPLLPITYRVTNWFKKNECPEATH
jgi:uncharacterized integral membrane protein (TIGR00697 family)